MTDMIDLECDLQTLLSDIALVREKLLPVKIKVEDDPKVTLVVAEEGSVWPRSPPSSSRKTKPFAKWTAKLRNTVSRAQKGQPCSPAPSSSNDAAIGELTAKDRENDDPLTTARRGSSSSGATLVNSPLAPAGDQQDPMTLLSYLAPLISALQRLTPKLTIAVGPDSPDRVQEDYRKICHELISLLTVLNEGCSASVSTSTDDPGGLLSGMERICDEHDLEMRSLLLSALVRKVKSEQAIFQQQSIQAVQEDERTDRPATTQKDSSSNEEDMGILSSSNDNDAHLQAPATIHACLSNASHRYPSPLFPIQNNNPFVFHSTSLDTTPLFVRPSPEKTPSPVSIPLLSSQDKGPNPQRKLSTAMDVPSSFQSFITASQQFESMSSDDSKSSRPGLLTAEDQPIWGVRDVFRLGSFQHSLLFSPSPVAVQRPLAKRIGSLA